jgi:hypothetical protein
MDPWPTIDSSPQYSAVSTHDVRHSPRAQSTKTCKCKFFLWDVVSYFKYRETKNQIRQNTYEGLGGRKFVRIQPGSILEKWYPQLRRGGLKKDGCLLCGYSFTDHLLYWSRCQQRSRREGASAFDLFVDSESRNVLKVAADNQVGYSFHRKYVEEVNSRNRRKWKKQGKVIRKSVDENISYLVPAFNPLADEKPKKLWTVFMLLAARVACLERIDDVIWIDKVVSLKKELDQ